MKRARDIFDDVRILFILLEEKIGGVGFPHSRGGEFLGLGLHQYFQLRQELRRLRAQAYSDERFLLSLYLLLNLAVQIDQILFWYAADKLIDGLLQGGAAERQNT